MDPLALLALLDLAVLLAAATLGAISLAKWAKHRTSGFPITRIVTHVTLQILSIGLWVSYVATGTLALAWTTFVVITVGQVFGDLLMFSSHRARHPATQRAGYRAVAADVLSFRRPAPALHAIVGAIAWFLMLASCIAASVR